jgi:hypothetical protein
MPVRNFLRSAAPFVPALALMALIFAFSAMPSDDPDKGLLVLLARKATHFSEYFVLTTLWWWALLPALAIAIGYAITDEIHQTFVDGRVGTWTDVLIDSAGALTAAWVIARSRTRSPARS